MDFLFIYLLKSSLSLILLYLSYEFFFRKEAYFRFSRYLLLSTVFLVILLPVIPYNAAQIISISSIPLSEIAQFTLNEIVITANSQPDNFLNETSIGLSLLIIYFLGVGVKLIQFLFRIIKIHSLVKRSKTYYTDGLNFVFAKKGTPTYSFLKWIFIDQELFNRSNDFTTIVAHEKIHATQGHTYDLIFAELLTIIQWFNPVAYLLKKTIKENHEYITDREVINNYQDKDSYQLLLLRHSSIIKSNILTHNFSYSLLKRRLNMMKKSKHTFGFGMRLIVLATTLVLIFFACSSPEGKNAQKEDQKTTVVKDEPLFMVVEIMPEFIGGEQAMFKYLQDNIKYPETAKKKGKQGSVFVSFIIEKDGKVSTVEIKKGIGDGCDEEAMRVIQNMPNWTPGQQRGEAVRVAYKLPIKFALQ